MNKRAAAAVAAAVMMINMIPAVSAEETVVIATADDFKSFAERCVSDAYSKNKTFVLKNDIDLKNTEIPSAEIFCGYFEGGGHTVKNVNIKTDGSAKGLFGTLSRDAQVHDLTVAGKVEAEGQSNTDTAARLRRRASDILKRNDIEAENLDASSKAVGGIVGYNEGKIVNCVFSGKLTGKNQTGGIAGVNALNGVIDNCVNEAVISGDSETGGIAGYNEGRIKLSKNKGAICPETTENTVKAGGICGHNKGALVICTNDAVIGAEGFGDNVGGICGTQSGEIRECINNGAVRGRRSVGGICGRFEPYTDIDLSYESAKEAVRQQGETLKKDIETAKTKLSDYTSNLLGGSLGSALGLGGVSRIGDAAVNMMNSISDVISTSLRDALDRGSTDLSDVSEEAVNAMSSLTDSLDSLDSFLDEFSGTGQEISSLIDNLNEAIDNGEADTDEIKDKLTARLDSLEKDIDDLTDKLDDTHVELNKMLRQLKNASGEAADLIEDIDRAVVNASSELKRLSASLNSMIKTIDGILKHIDGSVPTLRPLPTLKPLPTLRPQYTPSPTDTPSGYSVDPDAEIETGYDVVARAGSAIRGLLTVTAYAEEEKTLFGDLKTTDIALPRYVGGENADTALVLYCVNNGEVSGGEMAGGIAGSIGFESAVKSGRSIKLPDGREVDSDAVLKAVVNSCVSSAPVTAKTSYAGGAAGRSDLGSIKNTLTTGEIKASDGSYAGGTAGFCGGEIVNCIAINDVDAKDHLGGIAGGGKDIRSSYSLPRLDGSKEKSGAVAGFISGEAASCYFIDEGLSGIDGANLSGKAEAVKPADMTSSDGVIPPALAGLGDSDYYMASDDVYLPQIRAIAQNKAENIGAILQSKSTELSRFHFNVIFKDRGEELRSMTVDYGTVLSDGDIPKLTANDGNVPVWDRDTKSPIIRHTTFNAEYNRATTTIAAGGDPPVLLVEGVFDEGTEITSLRDEDIEHKFDGYKNGSAYSFTLSRAAYGTIKVHIRDEKKKAAAAGIRINGHWETVDCTTDGSYAVFEINEPAPFVILYKRVSPIIPISIIIVTLGLTACALFIYRRFRRNGKKEIQKL